MKLKLINGLRWLREYWFVWLVLLSIYFVMGYLLIEPLGVKLEVFFVWLALPMGLGFLLSRLPLGSFALRVPTRFPSFMGGRLGALYLLNEFRQVSTWFLIGACGFVLTQFKDLHPLLVALIFQIPIQRILFGVNGWRQFAFLTKPDSTGLDLVRSIRAVATIEAVLVCLGRPEDIWVAAAVAIAASSVALEGDSGRPILVNVLSLVIGGLAAALCYWHWGWGLGILYFAMKVGELSLRRFRSVENFAEDALI